MLRGLRHYWFEFDLVGVECPPGTREGVGVTAYGRSDAVEILASRVFVDQGIPMITFEVEDVDFAKLCPWLVLPNMVEPWLRGVWFPVGFSEIAKSRPRLARPTDD